MKKSEFDNEEKKIALWGIGDWGIRIVGSVQPEYSRRVKVVALDTDMQSLVCSPVTHKIAIGENATGGLGSGGDTEKAEKALRENEEKIQEELQSCEFLLIVGGLGGGVGSGVIPQLCDIASRENIITLVLITRPFGFEGKKKKTRFQQAREKIEETSVGLACFSLDRLVGRIGDNTTHDEVFQRCDRILKQAVESVISYLSAPTPPGGDYASLNTLLSQSGETVMGIFESSHPDKLIGAVKGALSDLSLSGSELESARGFLLQIESGEPLPFRQVEQAINSLSGMTGDDAELLYSLNHNKDLEEKIIVRIIAGGIPEREKGKVSTSRPVTLTARGHPGKQTMIDFNKYTRGDFARAEPTVQDGEDLDIPTFVRKGVTLD